MIKELKAQCEYEEVEDIIIDIASEVVNVQKENTITEYNITNKCDCEIDNISITKKKDKYIVNVNGIKDELKRDKKEYLKLMLRIFEFLTLSETLKLKKKIETN